MKHFRLLLSVLVLCLLFCGGIAIAEITPLIQDDADLLSPEEEALLFEDMLPICDYGTPIFWSTNDEGDYESLARSFYHEHLANGESGTLFVINMSARQLTIFSDGYIYKIITEDVAEAITGNIYRMASRGQYYACASSTFNQIAGELERSEPQKSPMTIAELYWRHSVQIEEGQEYEESDWKLPDGATLIEEKEEIHHYDQILDHYEEQEVQRSRRILDHYETYYTYEDEGDGTYKEVSHERPVYTTEYYTETADAPVYVSTPIKQTKYYYTIKRWTPIRTSILQGNDHDIYWPHPELRENEREGTKSADYKAHLKDESGKELTLVLDETNWLKLRIGDTVYMCNEDGIIVLYSQNGDKISIMEASE